MQNFWKDNKEYYGIVEKGLFQTRCVIGLENNRDGEIIIPISLKTTGSAGLIGTNEIRGLDGCWSIAIFQAVFFLTCLIKPV